MEALRRLRRSSSETNVDRRLVTNVMLSFLTTPRADPKRFEMLQLMATILSWSEDEREKAGLQRSASAMLPSSSSLFWGRSTTSSPASKPAELQKTDETEVRSLLDGQSHALTCPHSPSPVYGSNFSSQRPVLGRALHHHILRHGRTGHCRAPRRKQRLGYHQRASTVSAGYLRSLLLRWPALRNSSLRVLRTKGRRRRFRERMDSRSDHSSHRYLLETLWALEEVWYRILCFCYPCIVRTSSALCVSILTIFAHVRTARYVRHRRYTLYPRMSE